MTPTEKDKLETLCKKWKLSELNITKGIFMADDNTGITLNLRGDAPVVGVTIAGTLHTEGHGNLKVADLQTEVNHIMKSKTDTLKVGKMAGLGTQKQEELKKGTTTAVCSGCNSNITGTIEIFQKIQEEYGQIYCQDCAKNADGKPETMTKPVKVPACRKCGLEVPHARALECFKNDEPCTCEDCGKEQRGENMEIDRTNLPEPRKKQELVIGTCEAVAVQYGIPAELANLFFMKMNEGLYIKNPGLLYLAGKKGYSRIEITTTYDEKNQEWSAECKIYPKLTKDILEGIAKLDKELQKIAFDFATAPTNGTGRASKASVKMTTMHAFLKEMAQTRAQNRALRAFTGYGGTSAEELPEAQIERE